MDKLIETAAKHANWVEVTLILSALKCGFYSDNAQVAMQSLFVMTQLVSILKKYPAGFEHM